MKSQLQLPVGEEVHLWLGVMADLHGHLGSLEPLLSDDERERASRFRRESDSRSFVAGRGMLRVLAGRYLDQPAHLLRFDYAARGKPRLASTQNPVGLEFNLSHAGNALLFAFSVGTAVGVDVERIQRKVDIPAVGRRVLHANEWSILHDAEPGRQRDLFFRYWVSKEAVLKAIGAGIGAGMQRIEVRFDKLDGSAALIDHAGLTGRRQWSLRMLDVMPDYTGATAVAGPEPTIIRRSLSALLPL